MRKKGSGMQVQEVEKSGWAVLGAGLTLAMCVLAIMIFSLGVIAVSGEWTGEKVNITGDLKKQQFVAGDNVSIDANIEDDVFAVGGKITMSGGRTHLLFAGTQEFELSRGTVRDLIVGAGNVTIRGAVEDDVLAGVCPLCWDDKGRMLIDTDARVGGDVHVAASVLEIKGRIEGDLRVAARRVIISGAIGGKVEIFGNEITILKGASIGAGLSTRGPFKPKIEEGASITGEVKHTESQEGFPEPAHIAENFIAFAIVIGVAWFLGVLLLGALAQAAVPGILNSAAARIKAQPWASVGYGLAWFLLVPAVIWLLFVTFVGIPAGVALGLMFWLMCILGALSGGYAIGLWLRGTKGDKPEFPGIGGRIGWTVLGLLIFFVIVAIPVAGWMLGFMIMLAGLGAVSGKMVETLRAA